MSQTVACIAISEKTGKRLGTVRLNKNARVGNTILVREKGKDLECKIVAINKEGQPWRVYVVTQETVFLISGKGPHTWLYDDDFVTD